MEDNFINFDVPQTFYDLNEAEARISSEKLDDYFDCKLESSKTPKSSETLNKINKLTTNLRNETIDNEINTSPDEQTNEISHTSPTKKQKTIPTQENMETKNEFVEKEKESIAVSKKSIGNKAIQEITESAPKRESPRLNAIAKVPPQQQAIRRSNANRGFSTGPNSTRRRSISSDSVFKPTQSSLSRARPPKKIQKMVGLKGLTEQDCKELEGIANLNKLSFNKMRSTSNNSRLTTTKVKEFSFATDSRIKNTGPVVDEGPVDFARSLRRRSSSNPVSSTTRTTTKPKPFNLSKPNKEDTVKKDFVSLAEMNLKFYTQPSNNQTKQSSQNNKCPSMTIPVTPKLSTTSRSRPVLGPTREEIEEKEYQEALKHSFKAKPLNKKIFEAPSSGLVVEKKAPTVPEPFDITDSKRAVTRSSLSNLCGSSSRFSSTNSLASVNDKWDKSSTTLKPFSFDKRDKRTQQKKEEKILKTIEEEKKLAEFHANPMPTFEEGVTGLPTKKPPAATKVAPFNLMVDVRGDMRQEMFEREKQMQEEEEQQRRKFKARGDDVVHKKPFIPEKSKKPLTDISGFTLNTEKRSEDRAKFDMNLKEKEDQQMAEKRQNEERKKIEEEIEVAEMRKKAIHKAQPIRNYKPVEIKHAVKPATVPQTPKFATSSRLRSRVDSLHSLDSGNSSMS